MAQIYPGRRYESHFLCYAAVVLESNNSTVRQTYSSTSSGTYAKSSSRTAIGVPLNGCAYVAYDFTSYQDFSTYWWFVAIRRTPGTTNPPTEVSYWDADWGRLPNGVTWYGPTKANVYSSGSITATGMYSRSSGGYRYLFGLAFFHPVNIQNDSELSCTVKYRGGSGFRVYAGVLYRDMMEWISRDVAAGETETLTGTEPMEVKFEPNALGGDHAYSVTDQRGSVRRIETTSSAYILKTEDNGIVNTPVVNDILVEDDGPIIIGDYLEEVWTDGDLLLFGDIEPGTDKLLYGTIGVGADKLLYESVVSSKDTPVPGTPTPGYGYALITISWSGGYDLDCLGYWTGVLEEDVGWNHGAAADGMTWQGDDTGTGPECILLGVTPATITTGVTLPTSTYKVHVNFYGEVTGTPLATVTVTYNGVTKSKADFTPSQNSGDEATTTDNFALITFLANGEPDSVV